MLAVRPHYFEFDHIGLVVALVPLQGRREAAAVGTEDFAQQRHIGLARRIDAHQGTEFGRPLMTARPGIEAPPAHARQAFSQLEQTDRLRQRGFSSATAPCRARKPHAASDRSPAIRPRPAKPGSANPGPRPRPARRMQRQDSYGLATPRHDRILPNSRLAYDHPQRGKTAGYFSVTA